MGDVDLIAWWRGHPRTVIAAALVVGAASALIVAILASGGSTRSPAAGQRSRTPPVASPPPAATVPPAATPPAPEPPAPGPPAKAAPSGKQFGVSVNVLFNDPSFSPAQIDAQLEAAHAAGADIARSDALWEASEPRAPVGGVHRYDWSFDDRIAGSLAAHGLRWLPIIDYTAPWAQSIAGVDHSPPSSQPDFAAYAGALAARYGPGGTFWTAHPGLAAEPIDTYEIWNEPDIGAFWSPTPDPGAYAQLYLRARDAITAADPGARVLVGGLTSGAHFILAMVAAQPDLLGHIDGVALHAYGATPRGVVRAVHKARRNLQSLGLGAVPLYVTEFGWVTRPPRAESWAPARLRPFYIAGTLATLGHLDCGVAMAVLYTWVTAERNPRSGADWFGIASPDGAATPDTMAFAAGVRAATAPGPAVHVCGQG